VTNKDSEPELSAGTVDILVKAREDAVGTLTAVQQKVIELAQAQNASISSYQEARKEIITQQRSLTALAYAYREQNQEIYLVGRAFQSVASIMSTGLRLYEQYNVAMIRTNQLTEAVTKAQDDYNAAVAEFGPNSTQATSASKALADAQAKLAQAQMQNNLMFAAMALQLPAMISQLERAREAFYVLSIAITQSTAAMGLFNAVSMAGPIGLLIAGIGALSILLAEEFNPAVREARQNLIDLEGGMARARMGTKDSLDITTGLATAMQAASTATQKSIETIVSEGLATNNTAKAVTSLTEAYANGRLTATQFAQDMRMLKQSDEEIEKVLANTTVEVKTWQEQFVASAQAAATAFKDAFTGPMAQLGPELSATMSNLVNITISAIDSGFIGQAQAGFQAFKDCVSGKMNDLPGMQQQTMDSIVAITNAAINSGLKGTAQEGIALFVQCATSKQLSMVQEIDGYLKQLQDSYASNNDKIYALTRQGKDDEAQLYIDANARIKTAIDQLTSWRETAVSGKPINIPITVTVDTANVMAEIDKIRGSMLNIGGTGKLAAGKMTVQVDTKQALADIRAVQTALNSITSKKVTITVNTGESVAAITQLLPALAKLEAAMDVLRLTPPFIEIIPGLTFALNNAIMQFEQLAIAVENFLKQLDQIPDSKDFKITDNIQTVMAELAQLQGAINSLHGTTIIISVITQYSSTGSPSPYVNPLGAGYVPTWIAPGGGYPTGLEPAYIPTIGGHYQYGGMVPEDMFAYVHRGEEIIPANEVRGGGKATPSMNPSVINFENRTFVQVDGETMQQTVEKRMIRNRQVGGRYG
jgi:hypothetical protein